MRTLVLSTLAAGLMIAAASSASAQTYMSTSYGSSFSSNRSTSWSSGPGGYSMQTNRSGSASQWGSVSINAYTPAGQFNGTFSTGSSRTWNATNGMYAGPYGSGSYGSIDRTRTNWNNGAWNAMTPGGTFGGSYNNFNRNTFGRSWSQTYP